MIAALLLVACCWGATNPFIKRGAAGLEHITRSHKDSSFLKRTGAELYYLFTTLNYLVPLVINLSGSSVYYYTLGDAGIHTFFLD
jgi:hypothetical protein